MEKMNKKRDFDLMKNKKGQFYLIAAIVIVAVIIGFAAVTNFYKRGNVAEKKVYYLANELDVEGSYVVDYSVYNGEEAIDLLKNFVEEYGKYAGEDRNIYFVFGNKRDIVVATYEEYISGTISVSGTGTPIGQDIEDKNFKTTRNPFGVDQDMVTINIEQDGEILPYTFTLNEGENFYFVISEDIPGRGRIVLDKPTNEGGRIKLSPSN